MTINNFIIIVRIINLYFLLEEFYIISISNEFEKPTQI